MLHQHRTNQVHAIGVITTVTAALAPAATTGSCRNRKRAGAVAAVWECTPSMSEHGTCMQQTASSLFCPSCLKFSSGILCFLVSVG